MKKLYIFIALILLCLSGCSQDKQGDIKQDVEQENIKADQAEENEIEQNKTNHVSDENQEDTVYMRAKYSDKVLDRSTVEGKFAVYFLGSEVHYTSYSYSQKGGDTVFLIAPWPPTACGPWETGSGAW